MSLEGVKAAYHFDDPTNMGADATGRGNVGSVTGAVQTIAGIVGSAARSNLNTKYISVPDSADLRANAAGFTLACMFRTSDNGNSTGYAAYKSGEYSLGMSLGLAFEMTGTDNALYRANISSITANEWHGVICRFQPGTIDINVDGGAQTHSAAMGVDPKHTSNALQLALGTILAANIDVDELVIWPDRALTDAESTYLWNNGKWRAFPFDVYYEPAIGDWTLPLGFKIIEDPQPRTVPVQKLSRAHGARVQTGYLAEKRFRIEGGFYKGPLDTSAIRPKIDSLRAALANAPFTLHIYSDRHYKNVQTDGPVDSYVPTGFNRFADISIPLITGDPFHYQNTETVDIWTPGTNRTLTVRENSDLDTGLSSPPVAPTFKFTVGGAGAVTIDWRWQNTTTDQEIALAGSVNGGDVIVVDCLNQTCTISGTDKMNLFDGQWLQLPVGDNAMSLTQTTGTVSQIESRWQERRW